MKFTHRRAVVVLAALLLPLALGHVAQASPPPASYSFDVLASIPEPATGLAGKYLARDFEADGLSDSGWTVYGADFLGALTGPFLPPATWPAAQGEGLWLQRVGGQPTLITASGLTDPEGVTFSQGGYLGPIDVNNSGDTVVAFRLSPAPAGGVDSRLNSGIYRYDRATGVLTTVAKTGSAAPEGLGNFAGFSFITSLSNTGEALFHGIIETASGTYAPAALSPKRFGVGIFHLTRDNTITPLLLPGDAAPSGGVFDNLRNGWLAENGDIVFGAHTSADPVCTSLSCNEGIYVRRAVTGDIESLAHVGDIAPIAPIGDWKYDTFAFGPRINARGDIVFTGGLRNLVTGVIGRGLFLYHDGEVQPIAYPDQVLSAAGDSYTVVQTTLNVHGYYLNDAGAVSFSAAITGDRNGDGRYDSAAFVWQDGEYSLVTKTGDTIDGAGTVLYNGNPAAFPPLLSVSRTITGPGAPNVSRAMINNRGQVMLVLTMADGSGRLVIATP